MKNDKASFSIIDLRTGLYLRTHEYTETDQVGHLDLNRNGRLIVSAHYDESGYIWRMPPFEKHALYQLNVVTDTNRRIQMDATQEDALGQIRACIANQDVARRLELVREARRIPGYENNTELLNLQAHLGKDCVISGLNGAIPLSEQESEDRYCRPIRFIEDGKSLIFIDETAYYRMEITQNRTAVRTYTGYALKTAVNRDASQYLLDGETRRARLMDANRNTLHTFFETIDQQFKNPIFFDKDKKAAFTQSNNLYRVDLESKVERLLGTTLMGEGLLCSIALSPDEKEIITGSSTGVISGTRKKNALSRAANVICCPLCITARNNLRHVSYKRRIISTPLQPNAIHFRAINQSVG